MAPIRSSLFLSTSTTTTTTATTSTSNPRSRSLSRLHLTSAPAALSLSLSLSSRADLTPVSSPRWRRLSAAPTPDVIAAAPDDSGTAPAAAGGSKTVVKRSLQETRATFGGAFLASFAESLGSCLARILSLLLACAAIVFFLCVCPKSVLQKIEHIKPAMQALFQAFKDSK